MLWENCAVRVCSDHRGPCAWQASTTLLGMRLCSRHYLVLLLRYVRGIDPSGVISTWEIRRTP